MVAVKYDLGVAELQRANTATDWLTAALLASAVWFGLWLLRRLAGRYKQYETISHPTPIRLIAYLIGNTKPFLFIALALFAAEQNLNLPLKIQHAVSNVVLVLIFLQIGLWAGRTVRFYLEIKEGERGTDRTLAGSLGIIKLVAGTLIWSVVILLTLDNVGVNITALLAGLGVGGVAVALALQNVLGDLFASLSIALDKPFFIGDTLTIDAFTGVVEHIGIKTTRLRSDAGEQIILSNADILKSRVRNFGRAMELRALAVLRVSYTTAGEKLQAIPKLVEGIVREQAHVRFERCHLKTFGETALQFELSYFVQQPSEHPVMDIQQAVNFRILEEFHRAGIEFVYVPPRTI